MRNTAVMIMAGGRGSRLGPLTCHRSKPAVPFGGRYRIVDFVLSNFVNSGYRRIFVLTQFMATSLIKHLNRNWRLSGLGEFVEIVPAQMRMGEFWYRGTADAVCQNLNLIRDERAEHVAVFGGDHIYLFAIDQMDAYHRDTGADVTVATIAVPQSQTRNFGIIEVDENWRIRRFLEKPEVGPEIPGKPGYCLASMGNYFFKAAALESILMDDYDDEASSHDFGHNILPKLVAAGGHVQAYDFTTNSIPYEPEGMLPYWRDVGTIESYFDANMELRARLPAMNVYNRHWRIRTAQRDYPPARFVRASEHGTSCAVDDSLVCEGTIVVSSTLREVVVGYDTFIHPGCIVEESVIFSGCDIGDGARLRRVLMDKNCTVEPGAVIGEDLAADRERFPFVSDTGIVVLPKGTVVPKEGPVQLAYDVEAMLRQDPNERAVLEAFTGRFTVSDRDRHSYESAGPRLHETGTARSPSRSDMAGAMVMSNTDES